MRRPARNSTNFKTRRTFLEVKTLLREKEQRMPKDLRPNLKTWSSQEKNFIIPFLTEGNPHNNFLTLQLKKAIDICMYIFLGIFTLEMMVKVRKTLPRNIKFKDGCYGVSLLNCIVISSEDNSVLPQSASLDSGIRPDVYLITVATLSFYLHRL